ncbi:sporulation protein [Bacillus coahuilensis m2-6]|uniref:GerMN domain-containing protein n=1 Tax=Bacillus coahuilensis TaxID=408580 RepID=UPI0007504A68|nr:GerMN domain-containing protein [Bacillus coahuilensis]KUP07001.1 sporulation protein [Bacillus coahuilensis m2-6]
MISHKKISATAIIVSAVALSGCGLFPTSGNPELDPPEDVSYLEEGSVEEVAQNDGENVTSSVTEDEEYTTMTELYLIDANGYVVAQNLPLPVTNSVAKQALEYLVANGPVNEILPNGFRAVLPADTMVDVDIQDGLAVVDFSKEFENYNAQDEKAILQSITWTMTQFEGVESVEIRVNGHSLTEMPVNGTPISKEGLSRKDGINLTLSDVVDIQGSKAVTVYYLAQSGEEVYYVPVTKRVSNSTDTISLVVNELIKGPDASSGLVTGLMPDVELLDSPTVKDGVATLNFNEFIFGSFEQKMISEHVLNSLILSITEGSAVEKVAITVNGEAEVLNESGESISEPVSRPEDINAISF